MNCYIVFTLLGCESVLHRGVLTTHAGCEMETAEANCSPEQKLTRLPERV
jgi:hypothetical protein